MDSNTIQNQILLAEELLDSGQYMSLQEEQIQDMLSAADDSIPLRLQIILILIRYRIYKGQMQQALDIALQAMHIATDQGASSAQLYMLIASIYEQNDNTAEAYNYYRKALHEYEDLIKKLNLQPDLFALSRQEYDIESLEYTSRALELSERLSYKGLMVLHSENLALAYFHLSDYTQSLEYMLRALVLADQQNDLYSIARLTAHIGNIYAALQEWSNALDEYQTALRNYDNLADKLGMMKVHIGMGRVYTNNQEYDKSSMIFAKALEFAVEIDDKNAQAAILYDMGILAEKQEDYYRSLLHFSTAMDCAQEMNDSFVVAACMASIGNIYAQPGYQDYNPQKAEWYLLNSLEIHKGKELKKIAQTTHRLLAELFELQIRWKEAYSHTVRYHTLEKEIRDAAARLRAEQLEFERRNARYQRQMAVDRARAEAMMQVLQNSLPPLIAERLIRRETFIADHFDGVTVLFMDLVDFVGIAATLPARHLVYMLNYIFSVADAVMNQYGLEKVKTIGDTYMAVGGAPVPMEDHAIRAAHAALDLMQEINGMQIDFPPELGPVPEQSPELQIQVRIGMHSGEAIGGIIGDKKFAYDFWGDAVNIASRMESHGQIGRIHVSEQFVRAVQSLYDAQHAEKEHILPLQFIPRGEIQVKGKGMMRTFFMERI
jgi:class 3 adenylate cyclase